MTQETINQTGCLAIIVRGSRFWDIPSIETTIIYLEGLITSSVTDSVEGGWSDGVTSDEGIASAISEERGAADDRPQPTESVTEEMIKPYLDT